MAKDKTEKVPVQYGDPTAIGPAPGIPTLKEALQAAPTAAEVLGRPQAYEAWYKGMRQEALDNG